MTRRIDPKAALTVAVLLAVFAVALLRTHRLQIPFQWNGWSAMRSRPVTSNPEDGIYTMFDAARAGDAKAYLDCFSGTLHDQVAATAKEESAEKFRAYLMNQNSTVQGMAVTVTDRPSAEEARARVEYVYSDHNEVQNVHLKKEGNRWKIVNIDSGEPVQPIVPYGTKATD